MEILKDFNIVNYKKFDTLSVTDIGQVNLITGDNDVGKTSLLEALLVRDSNLDWISYLHQTLCFRKIHIHPNKINSKDIKFPSENFLNYIFKDINQKLICKYTLSSGVQKEIAIQYKTIENITESEFSYRKDKYDINNAKDWLVFYKDGTIDELQWLYFDDKERNLRYGYWPFIAFNSGYGADLHGYLKSFSAKATELDYSDKQTIIRYLKIWIEDIVDYELKPFGRDILVGIATKKDGSYKSLTTFGDGIQKFFRYVVEILYAQKKGESRILIDEIDTGIHYSRMKEEWKAVYELANQTGIQIFATTHSLDCIKAFVEASDDMNISEKIRLIELKQASINGENKVYSTTYREGQIQAAIESDVNIRGGRIYGKY